MDAYCVVSILLHGLNEDYAIKKSEGAGLCLVTNTPYSRHTDPTLSVSVGTRTGSVLSAFTLRDGALVADEGAGTLAMMNMETRAARSITPG